MIDIAIEVEAQGWVAALPDVEALVRQAATAAAASDGAEGEGAYVLLLADDATLHDLNHRFRNKDAATNVLSFPAAESAAPHRGDVALALETCVAEAKAQGKPLADHLQHLVVHGVLHLLGFDHIEDDEAEAMESRERDVLATLGVPDPYAVRAPPTDVLFHRSEDGV
jgi:probable rRNA maturation factor